MMHAPKATEQIKPNRNQEDLRVESQITFDRNLDVKNEEQTLDGRVVSSAASSNMSTSDFTVIWHNLTYKVDSRPWFKKFCERCFRPSDTESKSSIQEIPNSMGSVSTGGAEKTVLDSICGDAKSGQLTGILGPSGAGKSTLLSCLFQNRTDGTTGHILVDRRRKGKLKVCFIPQHDYLNEWLTVREDLIFVSRLKTAKKITNIARDRSESITPPEQTQPGNLSYVKQNGNEFSTTLIDHEANAIRVAELLGINNCLDVMVKKISGGQKKRLSIARELMSKPDVLILDEPTTGLDSLTCYKTMVVLRDLAHLSPHPMAVIVTIHQPQRSVFELFDKTYVLGKKGRVLYDDNPKEVVKTLDTVAGAKLPLPNYNPASFLIEIASDEQQKDLVDALSAHQENKFNETYDTQYIRRMMKAKPSSSSNQSWSFCALKERASIQSSRSNTPPKLSEIPLVLTSDKMKQETNSGETVVKIIDDLGSTSGELESNDYFISYQLRNCLSSHSSSTVESFRHIFILTQRSWLSVIRNPSLTKSRFVFYALLPLIMLMIYGDKSGKINNCPKLSVELDMQEMSKSVEDGTVAKNIDEIRLGATNISFFFMLLYGFAINIISCTASFYPLTMNMFKKETINGLYSPGPYFIGQMIAELPLEIFFPTMSMLISYQLSGQQSSYLEWRMFAVALIVFLCCYAAHAFGLLCGALFINNVNVSVMFGQAALMFPILLSGFLIRLERMPSWMHHLSNLSIFRHGLFGVTAARYGFNLCDCHEEDIPPDGQVGFQAMPDNVRNVMDYLFPKNESDPNSMKITDVFDELGRKFVKAETMAIDIKSCADVKPYPMTMFSVDDVDLFISIMSFAIIIVLLKVVTFTIMKSFPHRIR